MSSLEAIFLGIVQGLTEFLPVSSSGHLTFFRELLGIETTDLTFEVAVHAATVLSTIVVFWKQIMKLITGFFSKEKNYEKKYVMMILVSMIPVFVVGMFFKDKVEAVFGSGLVIVGIMLIVTACLLSVSEILTKLQLKRGEEGKPLSFKTTFLMGCAQAVAVLPGLSRSGSTISTGLILGVKKDDVAQFSFLMVLIPILGEAFLEVVGGDLASESSIEAVPLFCGFVAAFLSGLFACKVMINLVKRVKLWGFAIYCAIMGVICMLLNLV